MVDATLTVIYDDEKTGIDAVKQGMKKGGFPVEGEPKFLEK